MICLANLSNYLEERILNHIFRGVASIPPANFYVALFLNNPTDAGTGNELSGVNYARKPITFTTPTQTEGSASISNETEITFDQAGSNWGTVTHAAIYDSLTGGNMYYYGALDTPKAIETNDILKVLANELVLTLA